MKRSNERIWTDMVVSFIPQGSHCWQASQISGTPWHPMACPLVEVPRSCGTSFSGRRILTSWTWSSARWADGSMGRWAPSDTLAIPIWSKSRPRVCRDFLLSFHFLSASERRCFLFLSLALIFLCSSCPFFLSYFPLPFLHRDTPKERNVPFS